MGQHRIHQHERSRRAGSRLIVGALAATLALAASAVSADLANAAAVPPTTTYAADQFDSTSSCSDSRGDGPVVYYTVPADVSAVSITAIGQAGATGSGSTPFHGPGGGGQGATVTAQVPVTPGEQLYISSAPGAAGFSASDGGYATFVSLDDACGQTGSFPYEPLVVAAGGGGGGSADDYGPGGTGGNAGGGGSDGGSNEADAGAGGSPGTSTGGGAGGAAAHGGNYTGAGAAGTAWEAYFGGGGGTDADGNPSGGGGGGGYFGGGGGGGSDDDGGGGGGGGGSYTEPGSSNVVEGLTSDDPSISFTPAAYYYSTSTTASASGPSSSPSQSITYTGTVSPDAGGDPTGSVAFTAVLGTSTIQMGSASLVNGSASIDYALPDGRWTVTAAYGGASDEAPSASSGVEVVLPAAPSGLTGTRGGTAASISWSAPATGAGDPTTGYNVYEGTIDAGESSTPVNSAPVTATNYAVSGLAAGTAYRFTVETLDSTDSSTASTVLTLKPHVAVTATTLSATPPPAPDVFVVNYLNDHVTEVPAGGGPQTSLGSGLSTPSGVAVDAAGDVYIADGLNDRVVEEPAGGGPQVTVATGPFQLRTASGVAVDAAGDLFIVDEENNRVIEVPAGGGTPTTVGTGLSNPLGVAVDAVGDVFIADEGNNRVVEVPADGGEQVTVGSGLSFPAAVAADAAGDVFIADAGNSRVVEVPAGSDTQTTVASGVYPLGVAVDAAGDLFIADAGHARVVELPAGGGSQTLVGSGFTEPSAVALDVPAAQSTPGAPVSLLATVATSPRGGASTGVVDFTQGTTQLGSASLSGGSPDTATLSTSALAEGSDQITATYAGDTYDHASQPSAPITVEVTTTPGPPTGLVAEPADAQAALSWTPPTSDGGARIAGYDIYEGATAGGESSTPINASPVTADNYAVGGETNGLTYYYTVTAVNSAGQSIPSNEASTLVRAVTGTTVAVTPPSAADLFIPNLTTNQVVETPAGGGAPTTVDTGALSLSTPDGVAVDAAGDVFIADEGNNRVVEVPVGGGTPTTVDTGPFQLLYPGGLAVDAAGDVFIADIGHSRVIEVPAGGGTPTTVGSGLSVPRGLALDAAGDLFIADEGNNRVVEVQPVSGTQTTLDTGSLSLNHPIGVAVDGAGDVYVADTNNGRVVKVPAGGGTPSIFDARQSLPIVPEGVAVDSAGDVFIGDDEQAQVIEVPAGGGSSSLVGSGNEPAVAVPVGEVVGGPVTLTATVVSSPLRAAPAGTVSFTAGATQLGTASLSGGFPDTATLTTTALRAGTEQITATYGGNTDDQASPPSAPLTVDVASAPGPPTGLVAAGVRGAPTATLSWSAPAATGGTSITGYDVYEGTSPGGESSTPVNSAPITSTGFTVDGLANGTTYYFTVEAINLAGSSAASDETSLTPGVPSSVSVIDTAVLGAQTGDSFTFTADATSPGGTPTGTVTWALSGPGLPVCAVSTLVAGEASCTVTAAQAGTYSATATYGGDAVYTGSTGVDATGSVAPATPSVTVTDDSPANNSVATGGQLSFAAAVAGPTAGAAPNGDLVWTVIAPDGAAVPCTPDPGLTSAANVSTYTCSVSGVVAGPYFATASYSGDFDYVPSAGSDTATVDLAPLEITASDTSSTYGAPPVVTPVYSGFQNGDGPASLATAPACTSTVSASSAVGSYPGANFCLAAADPNYAITYAAGSDDVAPAGVSLTVSGSQTYGGGPSFDVTGYDGLVAGDTPAVLSGALGSCATSVGASSAVGSYAQTITGCGGLADANYTITYADGGFTVGAAPLTITPSGPVMVYGAAVPPVTASYAGFVAGDTPASLSTSVSCSTTATSNSTVDGSPYASSCTGAVDPNYTFSYVPANVRVTPAPLSADVAGTQTYGGSPTFAVSGYSGFVDGDTQADLTGSLAGCTTSTSMSAAVGAYPATISDCRGLADDNYSIAYEDHGLTVTPAALTITAGSPSMAYGASVLAITPTYSGFATGDTASALTTGPGCSTTATSASTVDGSPYRSSCTGAVDANYTIAYAPGSVAVTPAPLRVSMSGSETYGGSPRFAVAGYTGLLGGDSAASLSGLLTGCSTSARSAPAGSYPATITGCAGLVDDNYQIGYVDAGFTVRPAPLSITASNGSSAYGAGVPAIAPSYAGLVGGDTPSSLTTAPRCSTTAQPSSPPGVYPTSCSGAVDGSYSTTYAAGSFTVSRATTTLIYTGPRSVPTPSKFVPTASLSSSAIACRTGRPVSFTMSGDPQTGLAGRYALGSATTIADGSTGGWRAADGAPAGRPISTFGWRVGRHTIVASSAASATCAGSATSQALDVVAPGSSMTGTGQYPVPGAGTARITFLAARAAGSPPTVTGQLRLVNDLRWQLVAGVTSYPRSSGTRGSLRGKGDLYRWNPALDSSQGGWALAASGVSYTASFTETAGSSPGAFGITIDYVPVGSLPGRLPNSGRIDLAHGRIALAP